MKKKAKVLDPYADRLWMSESIECNISISGESIEILADKFNKISKDVREKYGSLVSSITLEEVWTGYEDMYLDIKVSRRETDQEYNGRIENEKAELAELEKERLEFEKKRLHNLKVQKQIEKLKMQLKK